VRYRGENALAVILVAGSIAGQLIMFLLLVGLNTGIVREHCLEEQASLTAGTVRVSSDWTLVLIPPFFLANLDPPGRCVRNSVLSESLNATGIRKLPPPQTQVQDHIESQLRDAEPNDG